MKAKIKKEEMISLMKKRNQKLKNQRLIHLKLNQRKSLS